MSLAQIALDARKDSEFYGTLSIMPKKNALIVERCPKGYLFIGKTLIVTVNFTRFNLESNRNHPTDKEAMKKRQGWKRYEHRSVLPIYDPNICHWNHLKAFIGSKV